MCNCIGCRTRSGCIYSRPDWYRIVSTPSTQAPDVSISARNFDTSDAAIAQLLAQEQAEVERLTAQLAQAQAERDRYKALATISKEVVDDQEWQKRTDEAEAQVAALVEFANEVIAMADQFKMGVHEDCNWGPIARDGRGLIASLPAAASKLLAAQRVAEAASKHDAAKGWLHPDDVSEFYEAKRAYKALR